jgi:hydrogenase-4 component B
MNALLAAAVICWALALLLALFGSLFVIARILLALGASAVAVCALVALPNSTPAIALPFGPGAGGLTFQLNAPALWLGFFGFAVAAVVCLLGTPVRRPRGWVVGAAIAMFGALGVFGVQDAVSFLIAWELMSLGGALMLISERLKSVEDPGESNLFMLGLLEVGAVALIAALLILAHAGDSFNFAAFPLAAETLPAWVQVGIGVLLLLGFGAKLGLLPFYEWFPDAYGSGSGASGALLSGVILNAAYFALARGLTQWLGLSFTLGVIVTVVAVISAILAVLYAFQEEDWRELLSFSSAENASIAVTMLGASLLFRNAGLNALAGLASIVALLHLAGHALAKGALFCAADGVYHAAGDYRITQRGLLNHSPRLFGVGAVFAGMSLAAMPPQAGFVSEWFAFQTVFQGFHMPGMAGRLVFSLTGAGLALTAAIAFATFIKVVGLGTQGASNWQGQLVPHGHSWACGLLGLSVLALAVGMPWWLSALDHSAVLRFGTHAAHAMHEGPILVPLTSSFAFISPTLLVIVCPLLAILPALLLWLSVRRHPLRRAPVWYGGFGHESPRVTTTALTFSNAMRVFYSFVYRPTLDVAHEHHEHESFVHRMHFTHAVAPLFGPTLFEPLLKLATTASERLRRLQSGHMTRYLGMIGASLVIALILAAI